MCEGLGRVGARPRRAAFLRGELEALWGNAPMCRKRGVESKKDCLRT